MLHARMLGYLNEVARVGTIRGASERLNIAASSISRQILVLEEGYGVKLFERLPRCLRLTVAGELMLEHIQQTLRGEEALRARFEGLKGGHGDRVRIAAVPDVMPTLMPRLLAIAQEHYPSVKLFIRSLPAESISEAVRSGEADLGLGYQLPDDAQLLVITRTPTRIVAVMADGHPLAHRSLMAIEDCADFPLVVPHRSLGIGDVLQDALARASISVEHMAETNSLEFLRSAALIGETISFMNEFEACELGMRGLVSRPIDASRLLGQELKLVARRDRKLEAASASIAGEIRRMMFPQSDGVRRSGIVDERLRSARLVDLEDGPMLQLTD